MENLYLRGSPLTPISHKMQNFMLNEAFVVNFILDPMGSFQDERRRERFHQMIDDLESIPNYNMGRAGTNLWTREYEETAQMWADEEEGGDIWEPATLALNYRSFAMDAKNVIMRRTRNNTRYIESFTWHM